MAQLTDFNKIRKSRRRRKLLKGLLILTAIGIAVYLLAGFIKQAGDLELKTLLSDFRAGLVSGKGFPVELPGGRLQRMEAADDTIVLLSDTNLYTYNATGKQMLNVQHGMSTQNMRVSGGRILMSDRSGTKVAMYSRSALIDSMTTSFPIYDSDLSRNGNFAVVTGADQYLAQVQVYTEKFENIYNVKSAKKPIISVSVSDTKDAMIVGYVDVEGGGYKSSMSLFQFSIDEEMGHADLPAGDLLLTADFHAGNAVRVLTDKRALSFTGDLKQTGEFEYGQYTPSRYAFARDGRMALELKSITGAGQDFLVVLDSQMKELGRFELKTEIIGLFLDEDYVYLTARNGITLYLPDGTFARTYPVDNLHCACVQKGILYTAGGEQLSAINLKETESGVQKEQPKDSGGAKGSDASGNEAGRSSAPARSGEESGMPGGSARENAASQPPDENAGAPQSGKLIKGEEAPAAGSGTGGQEESGTAGIDTALREAPDAVAGSKGGASDTP